MSGFRNTQRKIFGISILFLLFALNAQAQKDWKLVKEEDGIKVYTKPEPGSDYKAFKAEMRVSCKIGDIINVLKRSDSINSWIVNCKGVKLLDQGDTDQYIYIETSLPFPFKSRDMVYHFQYSGNDSEQSEVIVTGIPGYIPPRSGIVRLAKANGSWLLKSVDTAITDVTYQMHVEPGGLIPAWLANPFIVNVPYSTFRELRKIVQKSK